MPELPEDRRKRFGDQYGLSFSEASQLVADRSLADYYEDTVKSCGNARGPPSGSGLNYCVNSRLRSFSSRVADYT